MIVIPRWRAASRRAFQVGKRFLELASLKRMAAHRWLASACLGRGQYDSATLLRLVEAPRNENAQSLETTVRVASVGFSPSHFNRR